MNSKKESSSSAGLDLVGLDWIELDRVGLDWVGLG